MLARFEPDHSIIERTFALVSADGMLLLCYFFATLS